MPITAANSKRPPPGALPCQTAFPAKSRDAKKHFFILHPLKILLILETAVKRPPVQKV
jgi:hypothetical protein